MAKHQGFLFVDNVKHPWTEDTITGAQLRQLAGLPQDAEIFRKIPGQPDQPISDTTTVQLDEHRPEHFSTQSPGSQAGNR